MSTVRELCSSCIGFEMNREKYVEEYKGKKVAQEEKWVGKRLNKWIETTDNRHLNFRQNRLKYNTENTFKLFLFVYKLTTIISSVSSVPLDLIDCVASAAS